MGKDNNIKYNEMLEKYLSDGINYEANTISKADKGDLEQLAADSYWQGWQDYKSFGREKKLSEQDSNCNKPDVINWVLFSEQQPPDIVKDYIIYDSYDKIRTLEWYEGDSFIHCSDGHWSDENGEEVTTVIYWAEKPCL